MVRNHLASSILTIFSISGAILHIDESADRTDRQDFLRLFMTAFLLYGRLSHAIILFHVLVVVEFSLIFCWYLIVACTLPWLEGLNIFFFLSSNIYWPTKSCENLNSIVSGSILVMDMESLHLFFEVHYAIVIIEVVWCFSNT